MSFFLTVYVVDFVVAIVLFPVWLAAALLVGRISRHPEPARVRRPAVAAAVVIGLGLLLLVARFVLVGGQAQSGIELVTDRKLVTLLMITLPAIAVVVSALPALAAVRRTARSGEPSALRAAATSPRLLGPVRLTAFGAVGGMFERFLPPARALWADLLVYGLVMVAAAVVITGLSRRRAREVQATGAIRRPGARTLVARAAGAVVAVGAVVLLVSNALAASAFPETFSMMRGAADDGGGTPVGMAGMDGMAGMAGPATGPTVSVADLTGPTAGVPDRTFDLVARQQKVTLASGAVVDAWTFNGQAPGPELRMREGELVEVRVRNELPADPVTVHWHGMDVPNAEDGVSGITQDAIGPGQDYVYRFRVNESGTRWYHSHQAASVQVIKGLFGPIVIDPATPGPADQVDTDADVQLHDWDTAAGPVTAMGTSDALEHRAAAPGSRQRLRLANTANYPKVVGLTGVPFRVTALDGGTVNQPTDLTSDRILLAAGGRVDVGFTMPATPVRLVDVAAPTAGIAFSADGKGDIPPVLDGPMFDPTTYGAPEPTPFGPDSHFDREFDMVFDEWLNFYDDRFGLLQTSNGQVYPDTPMHMVREGDLVKFRFVNRASEDHPMHLHGHHVLELSRDGRPTTGSPIWLDTVNVAPGETVEVGFRADNPGLWMDHCHNLVHTDLGLILHLAYKNVSTPYMVGGAAHNVPE